MSCYCQQHSDQTFTEIECLNKTYNELRVARKLPEVSFNNVGEIAPKKLVRADNTRDREGLVSSSFVYVGEVIIFSQFIRNISATHFTFSINNRIDDGTQIIEEFNRL